MKSIWVFLAMIVSFASSSLAETREMDFYVYYITEGAKPDAQAERFVRILLAETEITVNAEILALPASLRFRIVSIEAWDPPDPYVYNLEETGEVVTDYRDLLARFQTPRNRLPANILYLVLAPGFLGAGDETGQKVLRMHGGADDRYGYKIALERYRSRRLDALKVSFLHELGHIVGLPDRWDDGCKALPYIMCPNTRERENNPYFDPRYRAGFQALWFIRARFPEER